MTIPKIPECYELLAKYEVPDNVIKHCEMVSNICRHLSEKFNERGFYVNVELVERVGLLHDIGKILGIEKKKDHCVLGAEIVTKEGFPELAELIELHGLNSVLEEKKITS